MSFCTGSLSVIRGLMGEITPFIDKTAGEVTTITGKIKAAEQTKLGQEIVSLIPNGSVLEIGFNSALDNITGTTNAVDGFIDRFTAWLDSATPLQKQGNLLLLAGQTVKALDVAAGNTPSADHIYDAATNIHIMSAKYAQDTAA